jgi:hypothetical protein
MSSRYCLSSFQRTMPGCSSGAAPGRSSPGTARCARVGPGRPQQHISAAASSDRPRAASARAVRGRAARAPPVVVAVPLGQCGATGSTMGDGTRQAGPIHTWMIGGMHAIEVAQSADPRSQIRREAQPVPGPGEVLILASDRGELHRHLFRSGLYPREVPSLPALSVAARGRVGEDVAALTVREPVGDRHAVGAYSEYSVAPADYVAYVPDLWRRMRRVGTAEGQDRTLSAQVGVCGAARGHHPRARRGRRVA